MSKKKTYDFIVSVPGFQPIGIKTTNAEQAHRLVMKALLKRFPDKQYIPFSYCNVTTKHERYIHAKSLTTTIIDRDQPALLCNHSLDQTLLLGQDHT